MLLSELMAHLESMEKQFGDNEVALVVDGQPVPMNREDVYYTSNGGIFVISKDRQIL